MKNWLVIVSVFLFSSCEVGWYDVWNDVWKHEPVYVSTVQLDFKDDENSIDFHISNDGSYNEVSFSIISEQEWLTIFPTNGTVEKGNDIIINATLNRSLLEEGDNVGSVIVDIEGKDYIISVSAFGVSDLVIDPEYLDFGASLSSKEVSLASKTGNNRLFIISPQSDWINVDVGRCFLFEENSEKKSTIITVSCDRFILSAGTHEGSILIKSEKETYITEYKVIVTIPEQGVQSFQIGDFVFYISKAPYRKPDGNVAIELIIENASSLYRTFTLESSSSRVISEDGNSYYVFSESINVKKKSKETMQINVSGVPNTVTSFKSVELDFSLSELVIFDNLTF